MIEPQSFSPPWWLKSPHLQTLWPHFFRRNLTPPYVRERVELPDGDFIDIDKIISTAANSSDNWVVLIHGLTGNSHSHYIKGLAIALSSSGYQVVAMNARSCSGELNRRAIFGHAGFTDDIAHLVKMISSANPDSNINLIGVSLGASMMLNFLSKEPYLSKHVNAAIAISTPFDLTQCAIRINTGFSKVIQYNLIKNLTHLTARKLAQMSLPGILPHWQKSQNFFDFDNAVTSRLHGFKNVSDYYQKCSTINQLKQINTPLLLIQSSDDPFTSDKAIPASSDLNPNSQLELSDHGGHVGFVNLNKLKLNYWLDQRVIKFFDNL